MDAQASSLAINQAPAQIRGSRSHRWMPWAWDALIVVVLAFLILYPTIMLLIGALTQVNPVVDGYHLSDLSIGNFLTVVGNPNVAAALANSLIACGGGTAVAVIIGAGFVIALQIAAILSTNTLSRFAVLTSDTASAFAPGPDSMAWWPVRARTTPQNSIFRTRI